MENFQSGIFFVAINNHLFANPKSKITINASKIMKVIKTPATVLAAMSSFPKIANVKKNEMERFLRF
jgi:hypothetical protein